MIPKIPLEEPEVIQIELPDDVELTDMIMFEVTDGIILHPDGSLIMVTFPGSIIYRLSSEDNWTSASRVATSVGHSPGWGTTVALRGKSVYVIYSYLNYWMEDLDQDTFEIVRVEFEED